MTLAVTLKIVRTNIVSLVIADFFLEAPCKTNGSRCSRASMRDAARGAIKCNSSTVNLFVSLWQRIFGATKRRIVSFHPSAIVTFQVCREAGEPKKRSSTPSIGRNDQNSFFLGRRFWRGFVIRIIVLLVPIIRWGSLSLASKPVPVQVPVQKQGCNANAPF